jgi:outer membrane immunogenic protein
MSAHRLSLFTAALLLGTSAARADDWTGVYIGIGGGMGAAVHDLSLENGPLAVPPPAFSASLDGLGAEGGFFTAGVGADYQVNSNVVVGAFFDYDWTDLETSLDVGVDVLGLTGSGGAKIEVENLWSIGGRVGYLVTPSTLLFLTAGYAQADISDLTAGIDGLGSATLASVGDVDGYFLGGGAELKITKALSLKAEYRYTDLDEERVTLLPGTPLEGINDFVTTKLDPDIQTARVSLAYRFGLGHGETHEPAPEEPVGSWSQFYVGIGGGYAFANNERTLSEGTDVPGTFNATLDGLGARGGAFTFGAGLDRQISERIVAGAFIDYTRHSADESLSLSIDPLLSARIGFGIDDEFSIGGRLGYLVTPATLVFGTIGYSRTDLDDTVLGASLLGNPFSVRLADNGSFDGIFLGAGFETKLSDNFSFKAEYRYTNNGSEATPLLPGLGLPVDELVRAELDPDIQTLRLSLGYRFNFDRGAEAEPLK